MIITLADARDEDIAFLGFITAEDGDAYLHASVEIYKDKDTGIQSVWFKNFMSGYVGKYHFKADRRDEKIAGGNGVCFMGAGRGRKPDKAYEDMRAFIKRISNMEFNIEDMELVERKKYETIYRMEA